MFLRKHRQIFFKIREVFFEMLSNHRISLFIKDIVGL